MSDLVISEFDLCAMCLCESVMEGEKRKREKEELTKGKVRLSETIYIALLVKVPDL